LFEIGQNSAAKLSNRSTFYLALLNNRPVGNTVECSPSHIVCWMWGTKMPRKNIASCEDDLLIYSELHSYSVSSSRSSVSHRRWIWLPIISEASTCHTKNAERLSLAYCNATCMTITKSHILNSQRGRKVYMTNNIFFYIYEESFLRFLSLFIVAAGNHLPDMAKSIVIGIRGQRLYSKKNIVYTGVDYNSNYLIVYFIVSFPPPQQKSLLLAEHICICLLISKKTNRKGRVWRR
jgi:hypothetical protein